MSIIASLSSGWLGSAVTYLVDRGLGIVCAILAAVASIYAIRVARLTIRLRNKQLREDENE